jgi:GTP cyclohydrolase I
VDNSQDSKRCDQEKASTRAAQFLNRLETDPEFREQMVQTAKRITSGIQQMYSQFVAVADQVANGVEVFLRKLTLVAGQVEPMFSCLIDGFNQLPEALRRAR